MGTVSLFRRKVNTHCLPGKRNNNICEFFFLWRCDPTRAMASFLRFLDHTQRRITVGRSPLDEWSARRRDFYLTTHNTHNRQISMPPDGIRTHDLSRRAAADLRLGPRGYWDRQYLRVKIRIWGSVFWYSSKPAFGWYSDWSSVGWLGLFYLWGEKRKQMRKETQKKKGQ